MPPIYSLRSPATPATVLAAAWDAPDHYALVHRSLWWGTMFVYRLATRHDYAIVTVDFRTGPGARGEAEALVRTAAPDATYLVARELYQNGAARDFARGGAPL